MLIGDGGAAYLSLKLGEGDLDSVKKGVGNAAVMNKLMPTAPAAMAPRFNLLSFKCCSSLLIAQRVDGISLGRLGSRVQTEENAHHRGE